MCHGIPTNRPYKSKTSCYVTFLHWYSEDCCSGSLFPLVTVASSHCIDLSSINRCNLLKAFVLIMDIAMSSGSECHNLSTHYVKKCFFLLLLNWKGMHNCGVRTTFKSRVLFNVEIIFTQQWCWFVLSGYFPLILLVWHELQFLSPKLLSLKGFS